MFHSIGYDICPIDVTELGMSIDELIKSDANIAYVTPSHQFPLGSVMPINRRIKLLNWANEHPDRYIIEDDYDSEFRYEGRPIPALQGNKSNSKVIYLGTLSKAIAPAIRLSFMVLPYPLLEKYNDKVQFYMSTVSRIDQAVVGEFISQGHFERHLNKMRGIYRGKHDYLLECLENLNGDFSIKGESAGLHLLLEFSEDYDTDWLIEQAKKAGVKVYSLDDYYIKKTKHNPTIILGFARLDKRDIEKGIILLKNAWKL